MNEMTLQSEVTAKEPVLYLALELSEKGWKLALSNGMRVREANVKKGDELELGKAIESARVKFNLPEKVRRVSCYEAGRDGFWIHRRLIAMGVENHVVDSSSIEVDRRQRRAKTDRIDAGKLLSQLVRYHRGEKQALRVVSVPKASDEDGRRPTRELERLKKERTQHTNRIRSLMALHGVNVPVGKNFLKAFEAARPKDVEQWPPALRAELVREFERLQLAEKQIVELEKSQLEMVKEKTSDGLVAKVVSLMTLYGVGIKGGWVLGAEFFGWRKFKNRREVGSAAGLTPTPFASGYVGREQGISKAGNRRVRAVMVELAWCWLRYQPDSDLSHWYQEKFGKGASRSRRVGIVALARQLLVALWRFVEQGIVPGGARLKAA